MNRTHLGIVYGPIKNPMVSSTPKVQVDDAESTLFELPIRNNRHLSALQLITKDNEGGSGNVGQGRSHDNGGGREKRTIEATLALKPRL